jgi:ABC-type bacteriocin/lantibiotic exporter with double-glycine peptidase domain
MTDWNSFLKPKTIFSLFPDEVIRGIDFNQYAVHIEANTEILKENEIPNDLYISSDSPLLLFRQEGNENHCFGSITPGRSTNLHSFLLMLPSQNSVVTKEACTAVRIPRSLMDKLFNAFPEAKIYLLRVTEHTTYRDLVKEMQSLGLEPGFIVRFISQLNSKECPPYSPVILAGANVTGPCFLKEGKFLVRSQHSKKDPWLAPLNSWVGWLDALDGTVSSHQISTLSQSICLRISTDALSTLRTQFPESFESLSKWISQGKLSDEESEDVSSEDEYVESTEDLFAGAITPKNKGWTFPFVRQNDQMDCGAACLSMLSLYFGKDLSVQFWRSKLSTDKDGTSIFDLAKTSEKFGFITHCLQVDELQAIEKAMFPFIALRNYHYIVVYKLDAKNVTIGDPAIGIRKISIEEFTTGFEKIGLFLKPLPQFLDLPDSHSRWKHYLHLFTGLKADIALALTCGLISVLLTLAPPLIGQLVLDEVLVNKDTELLLILVGVSAFVLFANSLVNWAQGYYFNFIMTKFTFRATTSFVQKMLSLPYQFFATRHVGDFTHRIAELSHLRSFLTGTLFQVAINLMTMFIYGFALAIISPKLASLILVLAPLMFLIPVLTSKVMSNLYAELFEKQSRQTSRLTDIVKGIAIIKSSGSEYTNKIRFEDQLAELLKVQSRFSMTSLNVNISTWGYYEFVNLAIMATSAYFGITGDLTAGKVVSFTLITSKIFNPLLQLTKQWDHFIETKSVITRLNDIFLAPSEKTSNPKNIPALKKESVLGQIEFRDVWFRYGGDATDWVLKGINFKIEAGQHVAIVGQSGSGKSTIAFLLTRMYEPTRGQILIDGKDYRDYDVHWLREQLGLLHQESFLFTGSIADNIGSNDLRPDHNRLVEAAERADALELIQNKANGFDSFIPHGGHGFSVGEKQRIALARMFYQNPNILILDEATSALDGISEKRILTAISNELSEKTILNIAHRYSTVRSSGFALVISQGKVAAFGAVDDLALTNPMFQELFALNDGPASKPRQVA